MSAPTPDPPREAAAWPRAGLLAAGAAAVLAAGATHYHPFIADDALISLRYARRLLEGHGLTWTDGERVEGYSNLLWVLATAGLGRVGFDLIAAARGLGLVCAAAVPLLLARSLPLGAPAGLFAAGAAGLGWALCGPVAVWSIGGLEQPLFCALLAAGLVPLLPMLEAGAFARGPALAAGGAFALLCWTRPDGPLFPGVAVVLLLARGGFRGPARRAALWLALPPLLAVASQELFRCLYYGDWLPNTARVKAQLTAPGLQGGLAYHLTSLRALWPLGLPVAAAAWAAWAHGFRRWHLLATLSMSAVWSAYIAAVGGDIFPAHRHQLPSIALACFAGAQGWLWLARRARAPRLRAGLVACTAAGLAAYHGLQRVDAENQRAVAERWEWDGQVMGPLFRDAFGPVRPLLAVTAAGSLPYFSGLPALDMQGLNDRHIARRTPHPAGSVGHDHGDGEYVLDREPDLMVFGGVRGGPPRFVSGWQISRDPRFLRDYRAVLFQGFDPHRALTEAYVRVRGRVGIRRGRDGAIHPGYLLRGPLVALPGADGRWVARLRAGRGARTHPLALGPGRYRVGVRPAGSAVTLALESGPGARLEPDPVEGAERGAPAGSPLGWQLRLAERARVVLRVRPLRGPTAVAELAIERVGPP